MNAAVLEELRSRLVREFLSFEQLLQRSGVEIVRPRAIRTQEQMFPRDPLLVVGDKIVISRMKEPSRQGEFGAIQTLLKGVKPCQLIGTPSDTFLEGGDVIVHDNTLFVGAGGARTSLNAADFLREHFPEMKVVVFELAAPDGEEDVLHLDCCLNFIGRNEVLMYPGGFRDAYHVRAQLESYDIITVSNEEQLNFATNVLSLSPSEVVSRPSTQELNEELRRRGYIVHEIDFGTVELFGGSFRCATHPLLRDG
jgi:N-dimethylarginine dimethylaminohydrolase